MRSSDLGNYYVQGLGEAPAVIFTWTHMQIDTQRSQCSSRPGLDQNNNQPGCAHWDCCQLTFSLHCFVETLTYIHRWFPECLPVCEHGHSTLETWCLHHEGKTLLPACVVLSEATEPASLKCPRPQALSSPTHPRIQARTQGDLRASAGACSPHLNGVRPSASSCICRQRVTSAHGVLVGSQCHWQWWDTFKLNPSRSPLSCCFTSWAVICAHTVVWVHKVPALPLLSPSWHVEAGERSALESASAQWQYPWS